MRILKNTFTALTVLFLITTANAAIKNPPTHKFNIDNPKMSLSKSTIQGDKTNVKLNAVLENYFLLKDELVKTDGVAAAAKAKLVAASLSEVKVNELSKEVHKVWIKVIKNLTADAKAIAATEDVKAQRVLFVNLSKKMYDLVKVAKFDAPVYYQFCPMANDGKGANWLSKENAIKNPYYGSKMLKCGEVVETIK